MSNQNPIITVAGKGMNLYVYEDRALLYKPNTQRSFVCRFIYTTKVMYRPASRENTGFIKMRSKDGMFDFITFKFKRETPEQQQAALSALIYAKDVINAKIAAARGLPEGTNVIQYF